MHNLQLTLALPLKFHIKFQIQLKLTNRFQTEYLDWSESTMPKKEEEET